MNDRSINLLTNLCAVPYPCGNMLDAIVAFKTHVPVLLAELTTADNKRTLAEAAMNNAVAQAEMARAETYRLREELRLIRAAAKRALGPEEPRDKWERKNIHGAAKTNGAP